jgi:hypothetical protein
VSALDSVTLIFVIAHFCFLLWVYGHVSTLKSAEAEYKESAEKYNAKVEQAIAANVEIAKPAERVAAETTKAEKLRNDTAYQLRKAAQAGARIQPRSQPASAPASLSTSPIELERPEKPKRSSTDFLTKWDFWVRMANFDENPMRGVMLFAWLLFIFFQNLLDELFDLIHLRLRSLRCFPVRGDGIGNGLSDRSSMHPVLPGNGPDRLLFKLIGSPYSLEQLHLGSPFQ